MTDFWSNWIIGLTLTNLALLLWLLVWTRKQSPEELAETDTMGHTFDGIEELNMPLPRWWLYLFYGSMIFTAGYLVLYPGLGKYVGSLNWTSAKQLDEEVQLAENYYAPIFEQYAAMPIEELIQYDEPLQVGQRLFGNNCAICHGSDAKGSKGFPNLTDNDWLYGGKPETIKQSIMNGRSGTMPSFGPVVKEEGAEKLANYLLSLSDRKHDAQLAAEGKKLFQQNCIACHGPDAKGNQMLGAPNLTDNTWLYGGSLKTIEETIMGGRKGNRMPAHKEVLGPEKAHVVAAYVYSLSHPKDK